MISDRIIIFILNLFSMEKLLTESYSAPLVYALIIYLAVEVRLITDLSGKPLTDKKLMRVKAAMVMQIIYTYVPIAVKGMHVILPVSLYDMLLLRNVPALFLYALSMAVSGLSGEMPLYSTLLCMAVTVVATLLYYRSSTNLSISHSLHKLRDDDALLNEKLQIGQAELMNAMDREIASAQLSERNRIAREIHDNVGHMLSRALLQTGAMLAVHKNEPVSEELKELRATLDTAMNSIRESVHDLRDDSIDLDGVIREIAGPLEAGGKTVSIELDHEDMVDGKVKYAIIGIVREAVSNIIKHSKNPCVDIRVTEHPSMYQVIVHDYGDMNSDGKSAKDREGQISGDTRGMGISNMESRAAGVGGTLTVSNDNGFRVFARLPK